MLRLTFLLCLITLPVAAAPLSGVKTAQLSAELYAAGTAAQDPLLLIAAAQLRKSLAFRGPAEAAPLEWQVMLSEAQAFAAGDEALLGIIADVQAEASKGVASGPVYQIGRLTPGAVDKFPAMAFAAGDYAEIYVEAKSATDLNLRVFDSQGQLVCADTDPSPIAYCGWTAATGGDFAVQVENLGPQDTGYALMTN